MFGVLCLSAPYALTPSMPRSSARTKTMFGLDAGAAPARAAGTAAMASSRRAVATAVFVMIVLALEDAPGQGNGMGTGCLPGRSGLSPDGRPLQSPAVRPARSARFARPGSLGPTTSLSLPAREGRGVAVPDGLVKAQVRVA